MKTPHFTDPGDADRAPPRPEPLASDLEALRSETARNLPDIDQTARALRTRALRKTEEGFLMNLFRPLKTRPWLATAVGLAVIAAVLLAVQVSYTRTIGYESRLLLPTPLPAGLDVSRIAEEYQRALDAESISVNLGPSHATVTARVPLGPRSTVEAAAASFAAELAERNLAATAEVRPLTERVTSNVYAMAANQIVEIQVNSEGKTGEEIAEEIRTQLADAGFENPMVDVAVGEGEMRIAIGVTREQCDEGLPALRVSVDGMEPPDPASCAEARCLKLQLDAEGKSCDEIEAEVQAQLEALGIDPSDVRVFVDEDGRVLVEAFEDCCSGQDEESNRSPKGPSGQESETWSEMKDRFRERE